MRRLSLADAARCARALRRDRSHREGRPAQPRRADGRCVDRVVASGRAGRRPQRSAGHGGIAMNAIDLQARMAHVGMAARTASHAIAKADTRRKKPGACCTSRPAVRRDAFAADGGQRRRPSRPARGRRPRGGPCSIVSALSDSDHRTDGLPASNRSSRCPIRSARSATCATSRPASRSAAMRVPLGVVGIIYEARPERDRRRGRPDDQVGQRGDPARAAPRGDPLQHTALAGLDPRRPGTGRACRPMSCRLIDSTDRSGRGRRDDHDARVHRRDRAAWQARA